MEGCQVSSVMIISLVLLERHFTHQIKQDKLPVHVKEKQKINKKNVFFCYFLLWNPHDCFFMCSAFKLSCCIGVYLNNLLVQNFIIFLYLYKEYMLWVFVRSSSARHFYWVLTTYVLWINKKWSGYTYCI